MDTKARKLLRFAIRYIFLVKFYFIYPYPNPLTPYYIHTSHIPIMTAVATSTGSDGSSNTAPHSHDDSVEVNLDPI